ncbi:hypothetical protein [Alkalimonas mucilaginosa]|uniref:PTS EIIA type-1 domain-containing protein n=1 Tax=Alkalimonas mucilaginosa TaxID=3057676 RepID=A0ABU7JHL3_9GAMM|nr:hypothetical protein [Alkalimonas sp. MEB004]MEE2025184.1 hypothetical protein [Alkalimonas sp. MEB004]
MQTVNTSSASRLQGFSVLAPADGYLQALNQAPNAVIRQLTSLGFCLRLSAPHVVSPCAGDARLEFCPHPCIRLRHSSGLHLRLELPETLLSRYGQGLHWQLQQGPVRPGQPLLTFDPLYLQYKPILSLAVFPHPAIWAEPIAVNRAVQALEPCFSIQLAGKNS